MRTKESKVPRLPVGIPFVFKFLAAHIERHPAHPKRVLASVLSRELVRSHGSRVQATKSPVESEDVERQYPKKAKDSSILCPTQVKEHKRTSLSLHQVRDSSLSLAFGAVVDLQQRHCAMQVAI